VIPVLAEDAAGRDLGGSDIEDVADVDSVTSAALRFRDGALVTLATACTLDWDGLWLSVSEDELIIRVNDALAVQVPGDPEAPAAGGPGARTDRSRQRTVISGR
jgi:hypothetical protein